MFAVLKTGGKQYKVMKDDKLLVEKIEAKKGDEILLKEVLMIGDGEKLNTGSPQIDDAAVLAEVIKQTRGPKINIIYKRRRKNSRRALGHKQDLTLLKIINISESGASKILPKKASENKISKKTETKSKTIETKQTSASKQMVAKEKKLISARNRCLINIDKLNWKDGFFRKDIGWRVIKGHENN